MGRRESRDPAPAPRLCNLFRVRINRGGYGDGGAYWGVGQPLYFLRGETIERFVRAWDRFAAIAALGVDPRCLKHGIRS